MPSTDFPFGYNLSTSDAFQNYTTNDVFSLRKRNHACQPRFSNHRRNAKYDRYVLRVEEETSTQDEAQESQEVHQVGD